MLSRVISPFKSTFRVSDSLKLDDGSQIPIIDGQLSSVEEVSPNGYRYRASFWRNVLSRQVVKDAIRNREMLGCEEHPISDEEYLKTPYSKATHVVLSATLKGDNPFGRFGILNNTNGNNLKALVDVGVPLGVSTRGLGDHLSDNISAYIDEDNYSLITWDIVNNPNFATLKMKHITDSMRDMPLFKELAQMHGLKDSRFEDYNKANLKKDMEKLVASLQSIITRL